jgi:hypothetical protein
MRFWWSLKCLPGGPRESRLRFFLCDYSTLSDAGRVVTFLGKIAVADGACVVVARSGTALLRRVFDMPCPY